MYLLCVLLTPPVWVVIFPGYLIFCFSFPSSSSPLLLLKKVSALCCLVNRTRFRVPCTSFSPVIPLELAYQNFGDKGGKVKIRKKKKKKSGDYLANCFRCRIISWGAVCVCAIACFGFFPLSLSRNKGRTTQTAVWNPRWSEWSGSTWSSSSWLSPLWLFNPLRLYSGCKLIDFWYFLYSTWSNAREQLLCSLSPIFVTISLVISVKVLKDKKERYLVNVKCLALKRKEIITNGFPSRRRRSLVTELDHGAIKF